VIEQVGQLGQLGVLTTIGTLATAVGAAYLAFLRYRDRRETAKENKAATVAAEQAKQAADKAKDAAELAARQNKQELVLIKGEVRTIGKAVDGRLSAFIKALEASAKLEVEAALAKGILQGAANEKAAESARVKQAANGGRRAKDPTGKLP
jgi:flagellar biosynthesis component FlhA